MKKSIVVVILSMFIQLIAAQNIGTKLGVVECINNNTFSLMASGNERKL